MGRRESQTICQTCRERHLKCNFKTLPCDNCTKSGRECHPTSPFLFRPVFKVDRIRSYHRQRKNNARNSLTEHQGSPSCRITLRRTFQGTREANLILVVESPPPVARMSCTPPQLCDAHNHEAPHTPGARSSSPGLGWVQSQWTSSLETLDALDGSWPPSVGQSEDTHSNTPSGLRVNSSPASPSRQMVKGHVEEFVFRFYISYAGPWLDAGSSRQHFGQTVPRLAVKDAVLYHACLAYASQVLLLHGKLEKWVYEQYSSEAISVLIPLLSPDCVHVGNETLLLAAVILRMAEQFSELEEDAKYHLRGACSLFTAVQEKLSPSCTDLRGVSFWTYVRESIRVCFLNEEGCQFDLEMVDGNLARTAAGQDEEAWANHMSYLLARLCNACWDGSEAEPRDLALGGISADIDAWHAGLPDSYRPWYSCREQDQTFRVLRFLSPWHELAWQQFYTAKVMLAVYRSTKPGKSNVLAWSQYFEAEILHPARLACSVCLSSSHVGCNTNGAHLIAWCGQFFTGKEEQRLLSDFLKSFMEMTAWPNKTCYDRLKQIWQGARLVWKDP